MASCPSPFRNMAKALLSLLTLSTTLTSAEEPAPNGYLYTPQQPLMPPPASIPARTNFHLRHILHHGTHRHPDLLRRLDVPPDMPIYYTDDPDTPFHTTTHKLLHPFPLSSSTLDIQRLADRNPERMETLMLTGRQHGRPLPLDASAWTIDSIPAPNITDKETVLSMARIANNAYYAFPNSSTSPSKGWLDIGHGYNYTNDFGWETDGLRGHIFADELNRTVVIGLKGTSPAVFDGADTTTNDKINDNLFFSCCCGQGGSVLWHQVCSCSTSSYTCNSTCLIQSLLEKDRYYTASQMLYHNVTALYPDADVWLAGHSLGGAVAGLLGLTYGLPTVTFEAPGDALPASRLGLPTPPGYRVGEFEPGEEPTTGGFHFGHTGDPVYMGVCSSCSIAGYAMESVCHTGRECRYDTVKDKGFHSYIGNHKIGAVIKDVLEAYDEVAKCEVVRECVDCFNWKFFDSNSSTPVTSTTTMSSSSEPRHTQTRTETCKTPGWFGCLDETTTSGSATSTSSSSMKKSSTSTCKTPGWFGCLDEITTTSKSTRQNSVTSTNSFPASATASSGSATCATPGWFGCKDPASTPASSTVAAPASRTAFGAGPTFTF